MQMFLDIVPAFFRKGKLLTSRRNAIPKGGARFKWLCRCQFTIRTFNPLRLSKLVNLPTVSMLDPHGSSTYR